MKNYLLSICLLLMSASALAQENVLSETWDQNLDLTIPSLEMPSISVLDSKDKHAIMMGWTCCYRKELIDSVQKEHLRKSTESLLRVNQKKLYEYTQFRLTHQLTLIWALFVALQLTRHLDNL